MKFATKISPLLKLYIILFLMFFYPNNLNNKRKTNDDVIQFNDVHQQIKDFIGIVKKQFSVQFIDIKFNNRICK